MLPPASLFVVSLPRSLSTVTYHAARRALGLAEPTWTTDGEILNLRRFAHLEQEGTVEADHRLSPWREDADCVQRDVGGDSENDANEHASEQGADASTKAALSMRLVCARFAHD